MSSKLEDIDNRWDFRIPSMLVNTDILWEILVSNLTGSYIYLPLRATDLAFRPRLHYEPRK